jgi:hypothetical protein
VDHEVVTRAGPDGKSGPGQDAATVHGPQFRTAGRHSGHYVTDIRDRYRPEGVDCCHIYLSAAWMDTKAYRQFTASIATDIDAGYSEL